MDFHGLTRRQLQALCKSNKIPANLTNVAMADALSALDNVEGIEEIMQPQGMEREETGSPEGQKTITRTSTRARKPPVRVLESGGGVSQSRARTNRKLVDDGGLIGDEKMDMEKTPAVAGSRQRGPTAASRKKVEVPSVQKVYSTRRSVRLVEQQLSELCLGESKMKRQPIKIDDELSSGMTMSNVKGDNLGSNEGIENEVNSKIVSAVVEAIDNADVVEENRVSSDMVDVAMCNADEELKIASDCVADLEVKEDVALQVAVEHEKEIHLDGEFSTVDLVEEESFNALADHDNVEKSIGEEIRMEALANEHVEAIENVQGSEDTVVVLDSSEPMHTAEKKIDAHCPALELTINIVKELSLPETENVNKENVVKDIFKVPKDALKDCSLRQLKKMMKGMNINDTDKKEKEVEANKFQLEDTPKPTRPALDILSGNIKI